MQSSLVYSVIIAITVVSLVVAFLLARWVLARDTGTVEMRKISDAIKAGAEAFLRRQNTTIALLSVLAAAVIFCGYYFFGGDLQKAVRMTISFVVGALCSGIAGYVGMS